MTAAFRSCQDDEFPVTNSKVQTDRSQTDIVKSNARHVSNERKPNHLDCDACVSFGIDASARKKTRAYGIATALHIAERNLFSQTHTPCSARNPTGIFARIGLTCQSHLRFEG